jgi:hypothetical protein
MGEAGSRHLRNKEALFHEPLDDRRHLLGRPPARLTFRLRNDAVGYPSPLAELGR